MDEFTKAGIFVPGYKIRNRSFWLFPIVVPNRYLFNDFLYNKGINTMRGATQLTLVGSDSPLYKQADNAKWLIDHVIYMPLH